jgi:predicted nucleic acid-binding protein
VAGNDSSLSPRFVVVSLYDAAYLEVAQRLTLPLGTLEKALRNAAKLIHVPVLGKGA